MTGAMKFQLDDWPRSSLSIGLGYRRCSGISSKFARSFAEGIRKLTRNILGDRWKNIGRLTARMPEAAGLTRPRTVALREQKVDCGSTAVERLPRTDNSRTMRPRVSSKLRLCDSDSLWAETALRQRPRAGSSRI
ncbi:hypothetical protein B296_00022557 [Ensete ventricosum]|uniref:Uncharacterized protein n=1 Tax=Ensete ventricosum TaxID=4639 RepID=A0A426Z5S0_ENSVE|nr:hypothetical protein B296_00022557 [Ensete ventricosum]